MSDKHIPNNSHNESSQNNGTENYPTNDCRLAAHLYEAHINDLTVKATMYEEPLLDVGKLQSQAIMASILQLNEENDLFLSALDMQEVIKILLEQMACDDLTPGQRMRRRDFINQLMLLSNTFMYLERNILPYTRI